ncbi:hypothetical protein HY251_16535 [bacterium]|nr:hypothetical protein [bacterium]
MNALFPTMYRIAEDVLRVDDEVLAKIRKHMQPGESESDVINRFLDTYRDAQIDDLMRRIS